MNRVRIRGRVRMPWGEVKECKVLFVPFGRMEGEELEALGRRRGVTFAAPPKGRTYYDVWVNGKKITRGSSKLCVVDGTELSLSLVLVPGYAEVISEEVIPV